MNTPIADPKMTRYMVFTSTILVFSLIGPIVKYFTFLIGLKIIWQYLKRHFLKYKLL